MRKPTVVKIVEALGWAYVALTALAGSFIVYDRSGYSATAVVGASLYSLTALTLPVGMVLSLRQGRREWFLWPLLFISMVAAIGFVVLAQMWIAAATALAIFALSCVLLHLHEASLWFDKMSEGREPERMGCLSWCLTIVSLALLMLIVTDVLCECGRSNWKKCLRVCSRARDIFAAMTQNDMAREAGEPWINPSAYSNSTDYVLALCAKTAGLATKLGNYTNIWCVVVDSPDVDSLPAIFTANLATADLLWQNDMRRCVTLTCPKEWGGVCFGPCEKVAIVVRRSGAAEIVQSKYLHSVDIPESLFPELAATYVLTPTGRVDFAAAVDISREASTRGNQSQTPVVE